MLKLCGKLIALMSIRSKKNIILPLKNWYKSFQNRRSDMNIKSSFLSKWSLFIHSPYCAEWFMTLHWVFYTLTPLSVRETCINRQMVYNYYIKNLYANMKSLWGQSSALNRLSGVVGMPTVLLQENGSWHIFLTLWKEHGYCINDLLEIMLMQMLNAHPYYVECCKAVLWKF